MVEAMIALLVAWIIGMILLMFAGGMASLLRRL